MRYFYECKYKYNILVIKSDNLPLFKLFQNFILSKEDILINKFEHFKFVVGFAFAFFHYQVHYSVHLIFLEHCQVR